MERLAMQYEEQRKRRVDKKTRVNPALDDFTHQKLQRLALACSTPGQTVSKTVLAGEIIELALNTPSFINHLQDMHHADKFRVIPLTHQGRVTFG